MMYICMYIVANILNMTKISIHIKSLNLKNEDEETRYLDDNPNIVLIAGFSLLSLFLSLISIVAYYLLSLI